MPGFISVVDLVGSVTVCNTRDIHDDQLQFNLPPGQYDLSPEDALRYVRSRHGSGGDFGRNERQQQVLAALRRELLKPANITRLPDIVEALSQVINTDFPPDQIDQLIAVADQVQAEPSQSWVFGFPEWAQHLPASQTNGRAVQFLRLDKIAALSVRLFGDKSLYYGTVAPDSPPPSSSPSPTPSADTTGVPGGCAANKHRRPSGRRQPNDWLPAPAVSRLACECVSTTAPRAKTTRKCCARSARSSTSVACVR